MSSVLSQYIVLCRAACLAHALYRHVRCWCNVWLLHILVNVRMTLLLWCSHCWLLLPAQIHFPSLFDTHVSICNVVDYMDLIMTLCKHILVPPRCLCLFLFPAPVVSFAWPRLFFFTYVCSHLQRGSSPESTIGSTKKVCWTPFLDEEVV
jgi:hypothetical protein